MVAWVRDWHKSGVGFVVAIVAMVQFFSEYLGFSAYHSFHQLLHNHHHHHHLSSRHWYDSQINDSSNSGLDSTLAKKTVVSILEIKDSGC
jgi:hypothetical protein